MISPEQCRAARAWLGWPQDELARRANVGISTLKDFESGKRTPMRNNLDALRRTLEAAGVTVTFDGERPAGIEVAGRSASDLDKVSRESTGEASAVNDMVHGSDIEAEN